MNHELLLHKLSNLGVIDDELAWFENYLQDRTQVVDYQGVSSDPEGVSVGVPQGSILGPLLFILHVNDLPEAVIRCNLLMYADDTVLFYSASQASIIEEKLNEELSVIERWLYKNSLFLNVSSYR